MIFDVVTLQLTLSAGARASTLSRVGICVRIAARYSSHSTCLFQYWWIADNAAHNAAFLRFRTVGAFVATAAAGISTIWVVNALHFVTNVV